VLLQQQSRRPGNPPTLNDLPQLVVDMLVRTNLHQENMVPATNLPTADNSSRPRIQRMKKALRKWTNVLLSFPPEDLVERLTPPHRLMMKIHHPDTIHTLS
jgi:hypothetical protein